MCKWPLIMIAKNWPWIGEVKEMTIIIKRDALKDLIEHFEKDVKGFRVKRTKEGYFAVTLVFCGKV